MQAESEQGIECPQCHEVFAPGYDLARCGHKNCNVIRCSSCALLCQECGGIRCEDHAFRTTFRGALPKPIHVCESCRNRGEEIAN